MRKLVVATSFPVYPGYGGGQRRILGLYAAMASLGIAVDLVGLVDRGQRGGVREIAPGLRELSVPRTRAHHDEESALYRRAGVPVSDVALALHADLTPAYGDALEEAARGAAAVVASHPFAQPAIAAACPELALIYESHNVELDLKTAMYAESEARDKLLEAVRGVEAACCAQADHVIVCSEEDGARLGGLYGLECDRSVVVPNGIDPGSMRFAALEERGARKARLGLGDSFQALFLGSWHEPNLAAVRDVLRAAVELPDVRFLVVGSAGLPFCDDPAPANVDFCGVVQAGFVRSVLGIVDAALNPMRWGSGTNLKMLDYAVAGVPLVSSVFGARGLDLEADRHYLPVDSDALATGLRALRSEPAGPTASRARAAREHVEDRFAWSTIARRWYEHPLLRELLDGVPA